MTYTWVKAGRCWYLLGTRVASSIASIEPTGVRSYHVRYSYTCDGGNTDSRWTTARSVSWAKGWVAKNFDRRFWEPPLIKEHNHARK